MTNDQWQWHQDVMDPDYMGRLRSVWHRHFGRGSLVFEDALQDCCIRYARFYGSNASSPEQTRRQFAGLLERHTRNMYHESAKWLCRWPAGPDGSPFDVAEPDVQDDQSSSHTVALLLEVVQRLDRLSRRQRSVFLAYCDFIEDHGGGSNEEFRAYVLNHHRIDLTTNTLKAHLNAARRRLWSLLIADGIVPNEPLQLKKVRSRWDQQYTTA